MPDFVIGALKCNYERRTTSANVFISLAITPIILQKYLSNKRDSTTWKETYTTRSKFPAARRLIRLVISELLAYSALKGSDTN